MFVILLKGEILLRKKKRKKGSSPSLLVSKWRGSLLLVFVSCLSTGPACADQMDSFVDTHNQKLRKKKEKKEKPPSFFSLLENHHHIHRQKDFERPLHHVLKRRMSVQCETLRTLPSKVSSSFSFSF